MFIEQIFPRVVQAKASLRERLVAEAVLAGFSDEQTNDIMSIVPEQLTHAECFLDGMTGLWRYEFGLPYDIADELIWGTHMWVPVRCLFVALGCACSRLSGGKRDSYLARLADPRRHQANLVEMAPLSKVDLAVPAEFEVAGLGVGNRTVDWVIGPYEHRAVLLDVKRRTADFIAQFEDMVPGDAAVPKPDHDPMLLFRSVEQKFVPADACSRLQGVWIATDIKQDEEALVRCFDQLDADKVHFAIFGDWETDVYVLSRRPEDETYLLGLFHAEKSSRFTFRPSNEC